MVLVNVTDFDLGENALIVNGGTVIDSSGNITWPINTTTVNASGATTLWGTLVMSGTPQTLTGAGAVNLTTFSTLLVTTGANALTLAAGTEGQF